MGAFEIVCLGVVFISWFVGSGEVSDSVIGICLEMVGRWFFFLDVVSVVNFI